jgi:hypothetical protein
MLLRWLTTAGLFLDIVGATVLSAGLIISKAEALKLGVPPLASEDESENLQLPQVRDRLVQSRNAKWGLALLVLGFLLQLIGSWPR